MEANFTACIRRGMCPVSACVPGSQEISWLDQKAISLLNANLFICPFSLPLCVPRLHIWSYHDRLWEKRNPLFSIEMEEKNLMVLGRPAAALLKLRLKSTLETGWEAAFGLLECTMDVVDMLVAYKLQ